MTMPFRFLAAPTIPAQDSHFRVYNRLPCALLNFLIPSTLMLSFK